MSELIMPNDKLLTLTADEIPTLDIVSGETQDLIDDMLAIAQGERDESNPKRKTMVGLAAPQIGKLLRIIVIDIAAQSGSKPNFEPELKVFINPNIISASVQRSTGREGCYSTGTIAGRVLRHNQVTVSAYDCDGKEFQYKSEDAFQARILQHEIDHLNGIRFPQRITNSEDLLKVEPEEFDDFRRNWQNWNKTASWQEWLDLINKS